MKVFFNFLLPFFFIFSFSFGATTKIQNFKLKTEDGKIITREDLKGKPSILVFWSLNCSSCKKELPILNKFYEKYKDKINFYAIVLFTKSLDKVKQRKKEWGFNIPVLFGNSRVMYKYRVIGVPTIYFVNKDLTIYKFLYGKVGKDQLKILIKNLLKNSSK